MATPSKEDSYTEVKDALHTRSTIIDLEDKSIVQDEDAEYDEEEDEDYNPDKDSDDKNKDEDDDELKHDKEFQKLDQQYKNAESSGVAGGLVKTRKSRLAEEEMLRKTKYDNVSSLSSNSSTVLSAWDLLKQKAAHRLQTNTSMSALDTNNESSIDTSPRPSNTGESPTQDDTKIKISRVYKFAGETHSEEKWVLKSSAAAKEYLNSLKFTESGNTTDTEQHQDPAKPLNKALRRPLRRPAMLEKIIAGSLKPKLSTLEKSKMDWAGFVDKEGITDELEQNSKSGYLVKQDFLHRVDKHKDSQYKNMRQKELAEKFKSST